MQLVRVGLVKACWNLLVQVRRSQAAVEQKIRKECEEIIDEVEDCNIQLCVCGLWTEICCVVGEERICRHDSQTNAKD